MKPPLTRTLRHPAGAIKLFWTKPAESYKKNFGEIITPLIIKRMFGLRCTWAHPNQCAIAGAGSIMEVLTAAREGNRPIVWGSGFIAEGDNNVDVDEFDTRALRGMESWKRIEGEPERTILFGDPGLLADCLLKQTPKKTYTLGVIPHIFDKDSAAVSWLSELRGVKVIDVYDSPRTVMTEIAACHFLLSSSLHGLIAPDSVTVPNAHLKISNKLLGGSCKVRDYYSAFENPSRYQPMTPDMITKERLFRITEIIGENYTPPADLDKIKKDLIDSFPYK